LTVFIIGLIIVTRLYINGMESVRLQDVVGFVNFGFIFKPQNVIAKDTNI